MLSYFSLLKLTGGDGEDIDGKIKWLKHHTEPKQQVKTWMQETCPSRASFIRDNKGLAAKDILERFPRLIDSEGMVCHRKYCRDSFRDFMGYYL